MPRLSRLFEQLWPTHTVLLAHDDNASGRADVAAVSEQHVSFVNLHVGTSRGAASAAASSHLGSFLDVDIRRPLKSHGTVLAAFDEKKAASGKTDHCGCSAKTSWNPSTFSCSPSQENVNDGKHNSFADNVCALTTNRDRHMAPIEVIVDANNDNFLKVPADELSAQGKSLLFLVATTERPPNTEDGRSPMSELGTG
eukprot:TRINITY_DN26788_c0_g1_i1.p1 TRINITY_DN26788_c0_g1~~TRINITY_DN26788_c0_g1_i1.p1  ORF type:complete len:197 (+),score=36.45 TRINITY_DN26788_c0_g1_i1:179-769(+)